MPDGFDGSNGKVGAVFWPVVLTVGVITGMVVCSDLLSEKEIIFPEIAAIAAGYLLAQRRAWQTDSIRIFILITICAWAGLAIVLFIPLSFYGQVLLAFAVSQLIYIWSGTTFAPLISAIVLPVMLQTRSVIYPLSASILTIIILVCRLLLQKAGIRPREPFRPLPVPSFRSHHTMDSAGLSSQLLLGAAKRIACIALFGYLCLRFGWTFMIAPPLLVAFTEFSNPQGNARRKPVSSILLITMCALAGAASRAVLTLRMGLPLGLAALCTAILLVIIMAIYDLYLPPAAAAALLAMLIPEESLLLYPVQIMTGAAVLMGSALLLFRHPGSVNAYRSRNTHQK